LEDGSAAEPQWCSPRLFSLAQTGLGLCLLDLYKRGESVYRNSTKVGSWALILGLLSIFSNPAQAALISANSAVVYDEGLFSGSVTINGVPANSGGSSASTIGYNSSVVPGLAASGHAEALFGALHATAFSAAANTGAAQTTTQTRGQGGALWIDQLTISSPTLTGSAFARATFSLSGGLSSLSDPLGAGAVGNSTVAAAVQINGGTVFSTTGQLVSRNGSITTNELRRSQSLNGVLDGGIVSSLAGDFIFDIPFVFGTSFQMFATLDVFTQALAAIAGDDASAASNFGSSGLWGGISGVHLADGTELTGYSISSDSGFDWSKAFSSGPVAVPVPPTLWLLGSGLLALIGLGRRTKAA
jgi:hypothetical protein